MGNEVELLRDGAATYRAMYQAIRGARHHINMETYIFRDDKIGLQMARLLAQKRQQGMFRDDLQASQPISSERWRQRPPASRLKELGAVLFERWL